ncbi:MAG: kelch repeat-containing protein [Planctomycetes bacterium]|nr:kelch repeat-containing protein [Planctomycetota bacterium]
MSNTQLSIPARTSDITFAIVIALFALQFLLGACGGEAQSSSQTDSIYNAPIVVATEPRSMEKRTNNFSEINIGEANVPLDKPLTAFFSAPLLQGSFMTNTDGVTNGTGAMMVVDNANRIVPGRWDLINDSQTVVTFTPGTWVGRQFTPGKWTFNTDYGFYVSDRLTGPTGAKYWKPYVMLFSTGATRPTVTPLGTMGFTSSIAGFPPADLYQPPPGTTSGLPIKRGPISGAFDAIQQTLAEARWAHTATALADNRIIVIGGLINGSGIFGTATDTSEVFNPTTDVFATGARLNTTRFGHTATRLDSGDVMVIAGSDGASFLDSAELYRPDTDPTKPGTFTLFSSLGLEGSDFRSNLEVGRWFHSTLPLGGSQLVVGGGWRDPSGLNIQSMGFAPLVVLGAAKIEAFVSGLFGTLEAAYNNRRGGQDAQFIPNLEGQSAILYMGGSNQLSPTNTTEILLIDSLNADLFKSTILPGPPMKTPRLYFNTITLDRDIVQGMVVAGGGASSTNPQGGVVIPAIASLEVYDPRLTYNGSDIGAFKTISSATLKNSRFAFGMTLLTSGKILVTGGIYILQPGQPQDDSSWHIVSSGQPPGALQDAILIDPNFNSLQNDRAQLVLKMAAAAVPAPIITDPQNQQNVSNQLAAARGWHSQTQLGTVQIIIAGDSGGPTATASADRYTE